MCALEVWQGFLEHLFRAYNPVLVGQGRVPQEVLRMNWRYPGRRRWMDRGWGWWLGYREEHAGRREQNVRGLEMTVQGVSVAAAWSEGKRGVVRWAARVCLQGLGDI